MLPNVNEFFSNLPQKRCSKCGDVMVELSECHTHLCEECGEKSVYPLTFTLEPKYRPTQVTTRLPD